MNPDWLLKHFEQISEAPDAVPRLRRFILDLAVRGKLVEQDPKDEPASKLLKRIEAEKAQLYKEKGLHKPKHTLVQKDEDFPCEIPAMWKWCNLSEISLKIHYGYTASANPRLQEIRLLRITDIQNNSVHWDSVPGCEIAHEQADQFLLADGDILIARTGGTIGKSFLVKDIPVKAVFASYLIRIRGSQNLFDRYLKLFLESPVYWTQLEKGSRGAGQPNVNGQTLGNMVVSVPPLAEQHRIVAKVDELMVLCDEFEASQAKRERRRDRLVAATLHGLHNDNDSSEPGGHPTFEESARFYFNHLPRLTTRPEHIQKLRQTILNLAVRGKLVPQDPKDEPAAALLKRIELEKQKLIKEGKLKKQEVLEPCDKTIIPFDISTGWEWEKAGTLFLNVTDGFHNTPKPTDDGYRYLTAKHIRPGKIDFESCLYVDEKNHKELFAKTRVKRGDILIVNIGAGCGNPAIVEVDFEFSFKNVAILNLPNELDRDYILAFLLHYRTIVFDELIKGGAQPFLGLNMLRQMLIPVPPLAEQHRIVAKVNELMALCDKLDARITSTAATRLQLLEATLHEAVSSSLISPF